MFIIKKNNVKVFLISIVFSLMMVIFPWSTLRNYDFIDLLRNIEKYRFPNYYFDYYSNIFSLRSFISDEPLWYYLNVFGAKLGLSPEVFFSIIAVFSLTIVCFYISKFSNYKYLFLLINPVSLDFFLSQQRSALCFSILVFTLFFLSKVKYIILLFLPLIHSISSMLFALFYFVSEVLKPGNKKIYNIVFVIVISLFFSFFLAYGRSLLSSYTDDARLGEYNTIVNSYVYLAPWFFYYLWFMFLSKNDDKNYYFLICFLSIYLLLSILDFYAIRFLAMAIPFMLVNLPNLRFRKLFIFVFIVHQTLLMYDWLKI